VTDERIEPGRDHHVVDQRDHRPDRHRPLEPPGDVDRDEEQHEQQAPDRLAGDLLAPRGPDVLHVDVLGRDLRVGREVAEQRLAVGHLGERVGADRDLFAPGHELDLGGQAVPVEHGLDLIGAHGRLDRVVQLRSADEVDREMEPAEDHADERQGDQDAREDEPPVPVLDQLQVRDPVAAVDRERAAQAHGVASGCSM
jgi:hypothetical protein